MWQLQFRHGDLIIFGSQCYNTRTIHFLSLFLVNFLALLCCSCFTVIPRKPVVKYLAQEWSLRLLLCVREFPDADVDITMKIQVQSSFVQLEVNVSVNHWLSHWLPGDTEMYKDESQSSLLRSLYFFCVLILWVFFLLRLRVVILVVGHKARVSD